MWFFDGCIVVNLVIIVVLRTTFEETKIFLDFGIYFEVFPQRVKIG